MNVLKGIGGDKRNMINTRRWTATVVVLITVLNLCVTQKGEKGTYEMIFKKHPVQLFRYQPV